MLHAERPASPDYIPLDLAAAEKDKPLLGHGDALLQTARRPRTAQEMARWDRRQRFSAQDEEFFDYYDTVECFLRPGDEVDKWGRSRRPGRRCGSPSACCKITGTTVSRGAASGFIQTSGAGYTGAASARSEAEDSLPTGEAFPASRSHQREPRASGTLVILWSRLDMLVRNSI